MSASVDCVVTDYNLPDGNALELLAFNKELGPACLPMVVLTGNDDDGLAIEALHEGAEDYLAKSRFEAQTFARSLRYAMERAAMRKSLEEANTRLRRELEIGGNIQTSILPRDLDAVGLSIAASMQPATEVGGDYYDVLPAGDGTWIAIGDVAGHGMAAAIVALMTQSVIAAVQKCLPDVPPSRAVTILNEVLYDNIRKRLRQDEHVTFTLLRFFNDGRVMFAGAHEELVVYRAATKTVETVMTPGTWLGARRHIGDVTSDEALTLEIDDVILLYTDGVTEAFNRDGEMFGLERLIPLLLEHGSESVHDLHEAVWARGQGMDPRAGRRHHLAGGAPVSLDFSSSRRSRDRRGAPMWREGPRGMNASSVSGAPSRCTMSMRWRASVSLKPMVRSALRVRWASSTAPASVWGVP